jgi:hypothetical protein
MPRKKKSDNINIETDDKGQLASFSWGPIKVQGPIGPSPEEMKLKNKLKEVIVAYNKLKVTNIVLNDRLKFYQSQQRELYSMLRELARTPPDKKAESIEKLQQWFKDITKDDNLEGK